MATKVNDPLVTASRLTERQRLEMLRGQLELERASFISHWKELNDFILPRRGRFQATDVNKGDRRTRNIIDSTATFSARTLASGMMSGVTSPARPWFRLTTPDQDLAEQGAVKGWLHLVSQRMSTVFLKSNLYNVLPTLYQDLGVFGTSAVAVLEDEDDTIRCFSFPIGSYMIANDSRLRTRVFMREYQMTVRQVVERFGRLSETGRPDWSHISVAVRNLWDKAALETWVPIIHAITPNTAANPDGLRSKDKAFRSVYYEKGQQALVGGDTGFLEEAGFDEFPILAARWETTGEDAYGTNCPGMTALGDIKQLQTMERRALQAVEKQINPPMKGPTALRTTRTSILPGDITYVDEREGQRGFTPVHEVRLDIGQLDVKQQQTRVRVQRAFFEDLFLMLAQSDRREITAREVDERHEEKLLALGPVLEQLNQDVLDPLIDRTFAIMHRRGMIPEPPQELEDTPLRVEYISIMAAAQKMVGLGGLDRFADFVGNIVKTTGDTTILDKVDRDQMVDEYADMTGIAPRIVVPDEQVLAVRQARAQQRQAAEQAAQLESMSKTAGNLAKADTSGKNALTDLVGAAAGGMLGSAPSQAPGAPGGGLA